MSTHTCPWWLGYFLLVPLRRLKEDPAKILGPLIRPGMNVLEPGPGMGFFSLELARRVGPDGRVVAVDLQEKMLAALRRRATKAGLESRIQTRRCTTEDLGVADLAGRIDFVLLFHMLHEVAEPDRFLRAVWTTLKPDGRLLFVEPAGHVSTEAFDASVKRLMALGLEPVGPAAERRFQVLFRRPADPKGMGI